MGVTKEQAKASQQAAFKKEASAQASGATAGGSPVGETSAQKAARQATTGGQTEAQKQAELHGLTTGGQFKEQTQQQFEQMSPALQREYNRQAEESQRAAMRRQAKEELGKPPAKYDDPEFAAAYEAGKGGRSKSEDKVIEETNVFRGSEAEYQEYVREFEEQNRIATEQNKKIEKELDEFSKSFLNIGGATVPASLVLPAEENLEKRVEAYNKFIAGYNVQQEKYYETKIKETAKGIVSEAKAKGATKIKIYTKEGEPLGSIGVVGAEEPIATQLRTGEFQVGYYVPKTAEQKAEYEKYKEEEKKFKVFVSKYKEIGATFDITKDGKLIGVTSKEHPYYDIKKAQREGEVSVSPTKTNYITGARLPEIKSGAYDQIAAAPFYNLGEFVRYAPQSMKEAIETTPKDATIVDRFTKGYSPKTTRETEIHAQRDIGMEYALTGKIPKGFTQQDIDIALAANLGLALIGYGIKGRTSSPKDFTGYDIAKSVKVPVREPINPAMVYETPTLTQKFRGTNPYREQLPKDLFEFDTAKTPAGSATPPRTEAGLLETLSKEQKAKMEQRNVLLEETSKETQAKLQEVQRGLLEPPKPVEPREPPPQTLTDIIETKGRPPISRPEEVFGESRLTTEESRISSEAVAKSFITPETQVYSSRGKFLGQFGERPKPLGAMGKAEPFVQEPLPSSLTSVIETKGRPPIPARPTEIVGESKLSLKEPTVSAEAVEFSLVRAEHEVYSSKGKFLGQVGERPPPLGAMGKIERIKLAKLKESSVPEPTNIQDYMLSIGRTKPIRTLGKVDTEKLLGGETPIEELTMGGPPIKTEFEMALKYQQEKVYWATEKTRTTQMEMNYERFIRHLKINPALAVKYGLSKIRKLPAAGEVKFATTHPGIVAYVEPTKPSEIVFNLGLDVKLKPKYGTPEKTATVIEHETIHNVLEKIGEPKASYMADNLIHDLTKIEFYTNKEWAAIRKARLSEPVTRQSLAEPLPRAEMVELTRIKPENITYKSTGKELGVFGDLPAPPGSVGILLKEIKPRVTKLKEPLEPTNLSKFAERLESNIVGGKKVKLERNIKKMDTDEILGLEKKPSQGLIDLQFRKFVEGTKSLKKGVQEVPGYQPSVKDFVSKYKSKKEVGAKLEPAKIDTDALLGIEREPSIGAPKDFTEAVPKELTRAERKALKAKQFGEPKTPVWKKFKTRRASGQILVTGEKEIIEPRPSASPIAILEAKPIGKPIEPRLVLRPIVVTDQREDEVQKNRLRTASKPILAITPKIEERGKLSGITTPIFGTREGLKTGQELGTKPRTELLTKTETIFVQEEKEKQRLTPKLTPRFAQDTPTPLTPKTKPALAQPLAQKQPQLQVPKMLIPQKPIKRLVFGWPPQPSERIKEKGKERELGSRADFLAGVPESRVVGIYKDRDITYGLAHISKLLAKERTGVKKSKGTKKTKSVKYGNIFKRSKSKRFRL